MFSELLKKTLKPNTMPDKWSTLVCKHSSNGYIRNCIRADWKLNSPTMILWERPLSKE